MTKNTIKALSDAGVDRVILFEKKGEPIREFSFANEDDRTLSLEHLGNDILIELSDLFTEYQVDSQQNDNTPYVATTLHVETGAIEACYSSVRREPTHGYAFDYSKAMNALGDEGVSEISVEYRGHDDHGEAIDVVFSYFIDNGMRVTHKMDDALMDTTDSLIYQLLADHVSGWEINHGSSGTLRLNLGSGELTIDHNENRIETEFTAVTSHVDNIMSHSPKAKNNLKMLANELADDALVVAAYSISKDEGGYIEASVDGEVLDPTLSALVEDFTVDVLNQIKTGIAERGGAEGELRINMKTDDIELRNNRGVMTSERTVINELIKSAVLREGTPAEQQQEIARPTP